MALSTDHIPLSRSLQERVEEQFAPEDRSEPCNPLSRRDICDYLAKSKDTDGSPLATIRRRASKQNRSPDLTPEHHAALAWVADAFTEWEDNYSLETPLRDQVRRLLPLAVAMAISDDAFFTPGAHPLHQLLDAIQSGAVGWQVRLDRAGQMLEQRVERSVEKALEWFNNDRVDISAITRELVSANERDAARAQRMVQRLEETEQARLKTLTAKRDAAELINGGLEQYQLPSAIGEFVKGAWYDSAQLVLVKFGDDSREWEQMSRATLHLMQSVQPLDDSSDADRDRQTQILRHLPGQLRRWLISLEHDSDATDSAIGLVEYAHLRIQHGQVLDLSQIPLIPVEELGGGPETSPDEFKNGEWYLFEDDEGELRAQLVLQLERGHHLLFTNFVGLKALDLSRLVFSQRLADGFATALPNRDTFSLSLAAAAGIDSNDKLKKFLDPNYEPEPVQEPELEADAESSADEEELDLDLDLDDGASDSSASAGGFGDAVSTEGASSSDTGSGADAGTSSGFGPGADPNTGAGAGAGGFSPDNGSANQGFGSPSDTNAGEGSASQSNVGGSDSAPGEPAGPFSSGFNQSPGQGSGPGGYSNNPTPASDTGFGSGSGSDAGSGSDSDYDPVLAPPEGAEVYGEPSPEYESPSSPTSPNTGAPNPAAGAPGYGATQSPPTQQPTESQPTAGSQYGSPSAPGSPSSSVGAPGGPTSDNGGSFGAAPTQSPAQSSQGSPGGGSFATPPAQTPPTTPTTNPSGTPGFEGTPTPQGGGTTYMGAPESTGAPPAGNLGGQAPQTPGYGAPPTTPSVPPAAPTAPGSPTTPSSPPPTQGGFGSPPPSAGAPPSEPLTGGESPVRPVDREIEVPMGAWLGFHDGETPIMAKLAVYDPRRDHYIFVNRKGIAMRELSKDELLVLMDRGLVDILETRNYFRDEVERARGEDS